jgi:hypothetical protein
VTTIVAFQPSPSSPFQFNAVLDGSTYVGIVTWSFFGRRYYLNVLDLAGTLVTSRPLIGSPTGIALQGISWSRGLATALTKVPHGFRLGTVANLSISGTTPAGYDGTFACSIVDKNTLTYALATDPGDPTTFGSVSYDVNLVAGYFKTSSLIFRQQAQQFEISP